jgi:tetratricopeptide (TPR) repeat protein
VEQGPVQVSGALGGRYTIERELGRGGMATVYLARDEKLGRPVALKLLHAELGARLGARRFLREIEIASRLTHPHILTLHESGEADGRLFYVMPYVEGESLRQRLQREGQLSLEETGRIARAVAAALDYAHAQGVVHRDVKPENILLARDPHGGPSTVLVADFGVARALDSAGGEGLTETGLVLGTPAYMSPEQATGSRRLDGRSDIYALGCVVYEMLAGAPPFTGPSPQAIMARHAADAIPPLRTLRPAVPRGLELAVERALAKTPVDRFRTAKEFVDALGGGRLASRLRRRSIERGRALLLTVLVAALAVAGVALLRRPVFTAVVPQASNIAVVPFLPASEGDTALARLGRDLAITVSAGLDGVGGIETADRLRLAAELPDQAALSPREAAALARRLGSASVLRGTLARGRESVKLDLRLYDSGNLAPLAKGVSVTGRADDLGPLTDSVVWALLRQVWRRGEAPSASLAAVTTGSLPALRAFLDGERHIERGEWRSAALAFHSAIAADSAFGLAYYRYVLARSWNEEAIEPEILSRLELNRWRLPEREQLLAAALAEAAGSLTREMELYQEVTRRYPDHWPAWFHYGDALYHEGPLMGYSWKETQRVFDRAVALNPKLRLAYFHMFVNSAGKDTAEALRAFNLLQWTPVSDPLANRVQESADLQHMRLVSALDRSGDRIGASDSGLADSVARFYLSGAIDESAKGAWPVSFLWHWNPAGQIAFNRRMLRHAADEAAAAPAYAGMGWAWAERGAWDSAITSMRRSTMGEPHIRGYSLAVLGAWLGTITPREAAVLRPAAQAWVDGLEEEGRKSDMLGQLAWLDGLLGFARRDRDALERARRAARRSGHPGTDAIERSLAAFGRALRGDRAGAAQDLVALERQCSENHWYRCGRTVAPNIAAHRLAAATWLLEAGDTAQAARLLIWIEARFTQWNWSFVVRPLAYLMLARIEKARGEAALAEEHYRQFLRHYDAPMPEQRHLADEARAALAGLAGRNEAERR